MRLKPLLPTSLLLALALAGCGGSSATSSSADDPGGPTGSTRVATWGDPDGDGQLRREPGEALTPRTTLAPERPAGATLATLVQLSDTHIRDEESPARPTFADRLGGAFSPLFRPQEALTGQVLAGALASARAVDPQAIVVTGDIIDNVEGTELDQALAVLRGGRVDPNTGGPGYEGPQEQTNPDPSFYRPDVDPPQHPGLLDEAEAPFTSPGHGDARLLLIPGNHDLLAEGEAQPTAAANRIAVGDRLLVRPDADRLSDLDRNPADIQQTLADLIGPGVLPGETERIAPDPRRRFLTADEVRASYRAASSPLPAADRGEGLDAIQDLGSRVRLVTLDFVQQGEARGGLVTPEDVAFLQRALRTAGDRWVLVASHDPIDKAEGGAQLLALLDRDPRVVATIAGDTHADRVAPRRSPAGGYWMLQTSSLADYPQQGRALQLRQTAGGGVVLETWMLDTAPSKLTDISRELAFLDAQGGRTTDRIGSRTDRNVSLYKAAP